MTHYILKERGNVTFRICSSLQEIVNIYDLLLLFLFSLKNFTEDQKRAFIFGSIPLLKNIGDTDDDSNHIQAFGVIQGLVGSGKSYVINSWKALAFHGDKSMQFNVLVLLELQRRTFSEKRLIHYYVLEIKN